LRLRGKLSNITLISTYAPTEDSPDAIKVEFYDQLSQECEKPHTYDILILSRDFNANISRENFIACFEYERIYKGTWMCSGTDVFNQIDHVIINKRHTSSIMEVRLCRRPSCDSDHFLGKVMLRERDGI
jgi:hypothetical protein